MKNAARHIASPAESAETIHTMQCMEVWGGNVAAETGISVHGIDAWLYSQPFHGEINGGDIHYVSMCGQGRIARFVLADVAGHGSAVNDLAVQLRTLMRKHVSTPDQTRFARSLNRTFGRLSREGLFATAALATYFAPTDELKVCLAGHPRPLWYHAMSDRWSLLTHDHDSSAPFAANLPLGIIRSTEYNQFAVTLEKGDLIVLYSDGLIETGGAREGHIGEAGLLSLAAQIDPSDPSTVGRSLIAAADAKSNWPSGMRDDDLTVLVLHHNAANPPPMSIWHKARMMVKMLGVG
ncbi:MAG: serine/threonine-protein phosphatase [Phycisphaerales bacterium]|nr:serine/threonine-protein phosphatase [Phycisphaerales bacterium]